MRYARGEAILRVIAMRYAPQLIVSQNEEMVNLTITLFARFWVNGNQDELLALLG